MHPTALCRMAFSDSDFIAERTGRLREYRGNVSGCVSRLSGLVRFVDVIVEGLFALVLVADSRFLFIVRPRYFMEF